MIPYIEFVVTEDEMNLVLEMGDQKMTMEELVEMVDMPAAEAEEFVTQAFYRGVLEREKDEETGEVRYAAATFYHRLDPMSMYEYWGDVPADARDAVIEWQLDEFINIWQPAIEKIQQDPDTFVMMPNRDVLLLEEALEMVEAATEHVIVPCDCRSIVMACDRPVEACVRLDEGAIRTLEHGHGRRVTKEEMKEIVINADREGLMHTGARTWEKYGRVFGFCNCCACDCYPFRAGEKLDMAQEWPRSHHIAERDMEKCIHCGLCTRRCHFEAFYRTGEVVEVNGKKRKAVAFDAEKCWGCGLCATACPEEAIVMRPLREESEATGELPEDLDVESLFAHSE
jgi:formate hydrogenlyase subunit 6/NADH:ubiquinone oxidoreductase subunit I